MRHAQDADVLTAGTRPNTRKSLRLAIPIAVAVAVVDQLTKRWALDTLEPGSCAAPDACIDLFAGVRFHLVFNTGAAFTSGSGYGPVLAVLAMVMAVLLLFLATKRTDRLGIVLFGLIVGGAVGNLIDRVFRAEDGLFSGAVVDFIDLGWWPVFNIADSAIVVGVVAFVLLAFFGEHGASDELAVPAAGETTPVAEQTVGVADDPEGRVVEPTADGDPNRAFEDVRGPEGALEDVRGPEGALEDVRGPEGALEDIVE